MPVLLDSTDIAIIKSLLKDGRKSFRQISRDTGITTPTVKARFERLVNIGFIKGVLPIFDFGKVNNKQEYIIQIQNINKETHRKVKENFHKNTDNNLFEEAYNIEKKIKNGLAINLICDYCQGPVFGKPRVLKFADIERFFCCYSCKTGYSEKYKSRIESIKRKYEGKSEIAI
ncbi:MAG TPA: winged helix-turn-helix transcriptional regulator [Nitrososphaeraceae archaeon]|nr:winged helix-turn-helix transcriptional regulator [Nitrososphaeraceae archaeon]